MLYVSKRL